MLRATAILQDILPKYFVSQLENKETQTYQTCTVDASVQTESDNTVSTNKLTTLMGDALVNVPGIIDTINTPSILLLLVKKNFILVFLTVDFYFCFAVIVYFL